MSDCGYILIVGCQGALMDFTDFCSCCRQGVMPVFHGGSAGMVGLALDPDYKMPDSYNGGNNAQRQFGIFQGTALLNMHFHKTFPRKQMRGKGIPFQSGFLEQLGKGLAFCCDKTARIFSLELSCHSLAAHAWGSESGAFFFGKGNDGQRAAGTESCLMPGCGNGQRDRNPQGSIIFSSMGNGIQMGTGIHRRKASFSRYSHEQITPAVPLALESGSFCVTMQIFQGLQERV